MSGKRGRPLKFDEALSVRLSARLTGTERSKLEWRADGEAISDLVRSWLADLDLHSTIDERAFMEVVEAGHQIKDAGEEYRAQPSTELQTAIIRMLEWHIDAGRRLARSMRDNGGFSLSDVPQFFAGREQRVCFRVAEAESVRLIRLARDHGLRRSDLIRDIVSDRRLVPARARIALYELRRQGHLIRLLSRIVGSRRRTTSELRSAIAACLQAWLEIQRAAAVARYASTDI